MSKTHDAVMPHDAKMEKQVLASLMNDRYVYDEIGEIIEDECFYVMKHRDIWRTIQKLRNRGEECDMTNVAYEVQKENAHIEMFDIADICTDFTSSVGVEQKACRLYDLMAKRRMWQIGAQMMADALNPSHDPSEVQTAATTALASVYEGKNNNIRTMADTLKDIENIIKDNLNEHKVHGAPTGFKEFDARGGLRPTALWIIAADSSTGKTSLAMSMMLACASAGFPVAIYSMEMTDVELTTRSLAITSGIENRRLAQQALTPEEISKYDKGCAFLQNLPIYYDDNSTSTIDSILHSIRTMHKKYGIKGVLIDYLQILNVNQKGLNQTEQLGDAARRLKNIAKELNIFVVALSQLNRDKENPEPNMGRLRKSGEIGEAADVVALIYRPELYHRQYSEPYTSISTHGTALINVAKGRNIGIFDFIVGFDAEHTRFYDYNPYDMASITNTTPTQTKDITGETMPF